jgi:hypothetical protein
MDARVPCIDVFLQFRAGSTPKAIVLPQDLTRKLSEDVCRRLSMATTKMINIHSTHEH